MANIRKDREDVITAACQQLAGAIMQQAVRDYKTAYKQELKKGQSTNSDLVTVPIFFQQAYDLGWTEHSPEWVISVCREICEEDIAEASGADAEELVFSEGASGYAGLFFAVIEQAIVDYKNAYRKYMNSRKGPKLSEKQGQSEALKTMKQIKSDLDQFYAMGLLKTNPDRIVYSVRAEYAAEQRACR